MSSWFSSAGSVTFANRIDCLLLLLLAAIMSDASAVV